MKLPPTVADHEDSTWQTIYMDLITALLILFLILWAIHQGAIDDQEGFGNKQAIAISFKGDNTFKIGSAEMHPKFEKDLERVLFSENVDKIFNLGVNPETMERSTLIINGHSSKDFQGKSVAEVANLHHRNMLLSVNRAFSVYEKTNRELAHKFKDVEQLSKVLESISVCGHSFNFQNYPEKIKNQRVTIESTTLDQENIVNVYP